MSVAVRVGGLARLRPSMAAAPGACADRRLHTGLRTGLIAAGLACAMLYASAGAALAGCKPSHPRPTIVLKSMGACTFDPLSFSFHGEPAEQAMCLMRAMDATRNLAPTLERLPPALATRIGQDSGLPSREALSTFLSKQNLEWDFAAYLWQPLSHANDDDPNAPMARYFVIHDTSGPNFGHRAFPADLDVDQKINNLANFKCSDGWGKAHVIVNRDGGMLLQRDFEIPWRETKFERAVNFAGALKGLFVHVELIQPRRSASGRGWSNDAQTPNPAFTAAQYDRLALLYVIASVRAEHWLIPAFHAAIDADIPNGHDDPLNFDVQSFADSLERITDKIVGAQANAAAPSNAGRTPVPWGEIDAAPEPNSSVTTPPNPPTMSGPPVPDASVEPALLAERSAENAQTAKTEPKTEPKIEIKTQNKTETSSEGRSERRSERKTRSAGDCETSHAKGHRRHGCGIDTAESRGRAKRTHLVRAMDRRVSHHGDGARHHGRDLRARHGRREA